MTDSEQPTPNGHEPSYLPNAVEIVRECAKIRASWSAAETARRAAWAQPARVELEEQPADWAR